MPAGGYEVRAKAPGFKPVTQSTVVVRSGELTNVGEMTLARAQQGALEPFLSSMPLVAVLQVSRPLQSDTLLEAGDGSINPNRSEEYELRALIPELGKLRSATSLPSWLSARGLREISDP